jgi:dolichyl-phosphate beta-glucosyltransferase
MTLAAAGAAYLVVGFVLWVHAWADGASTHTLCGCGDPALFLWFFQWPATALAHAENPFYSTALFHPTGINLLAQTSTMGLSLPLVPVTWIWGPVASLNVASTLTPALTAFFAFVVIRRWAPWTPAAFIGGLLYGFSPFVLSSLEFAHLMTAALMLLPLILAVLDEILIRQRHSAIWSGVLLAVLAFGQFFLSSEILAIVALVTAVCVFVLAVAAFVADRAALRRLAPHAATALGIGLVVSTVLLAWPVWFALDGPAHLSGLVWPHIETIGGFVPSYFVSADYPPPHNVFQTLGGYGGAPLASAAFLGWGLIAVLLAGCVAFWRDRRVWFFGFLLLLCAGCSLGARHGQWEPERVFAHIPVIENVIVQRFMAIGFLAAAVLLANILDHVHSLLPDWRGAVGALALTGVALVPVAAMFGSRLPFTMRPVALPPWYTEVAPSLPPGRVLLSYPAPFSGIQSAMAWQAVNGMHYSQAGGGGPQGVAHRAGTAAAGFRVLSMLSLPQGLPPPAGTPAQLAAVRHALAVWQVNTVVVATDPAVSRAEAGRDPVYAAAFMTAALGRLPTIQAGAWVWDHVQLNLHRPLRPNALTLLGCVRSAEGSSGRAVASMRVPVCVVRGPLGRP